jgi:hypothetical protein
MTRTRAIDPWTELELAVRHALAVRTASRAAVAECARFCGYAHGDGAFRAHAQALNALKALALGWRDVPETARAAYEATLQSLSDALRTWPAEQRATPACLADAKRRKDERRALAMRRTAAAAATPPYWIND